MSVALLNRTQGLTCFVCPYIHAPTAGRPLKSPTTGEPLADIMFPNFVVRSLVAAYIGEKRKEFQERRQRQRQQRQRRASLKLVGFV
jgi:hypothetical protein